MIQSDAQLGRAIRELLAARGSVCLFAPMADADTPAEESFAVVTAALSYEGGRAFYGDAMEDALEGAIEEIRTGRRRPKYRRRRK